MGKTKEENLPVLKDAGLNSAALAQFADYDLTQFADLKLDVADNADLFSNDILIPKVWLVQAMSQLRKDKKADEGDYVDSQTGEILAAEGEELKFTVLKTFKRWHSFEVVGDKLEFLSSEIFTLKNANLPYEEESEGKKIRRRQVLSAYILLEREAVRGVNKPYVIDFYSSSKLAGRKLVSDIKTLNDAKMPSFVGFWKLTSSEEKFDKGEAYVKNIEFGGYLPKESMKFLIECRNTIDSLEDQIEIDDRDLINTTSKEADANVNAEAEGSGANI